MWKEGRRRWWGGRGTGGCVIIDGFPRRWGGGSRSRTPSARPSPESSPSRRYMWFFVRVCETSHGFQLFFNVWNVFNVNRTYSCFLSYVIIQFHFSITIIIRCDDGCGRNKLKLLGPSVIVCVWESIHARPSHHHTWNFAVFFWWFLFFLWVLQTCFFTFFSRPSSRE